MSNIKNMFECSRTRLVVFYFKLLLILAMVTFGAECRHVQSPSSVKRVKTLTSLENGNVTVKKTGSVHKLSQRTVQDVIESMGVLSSGNVSHLANKIFKLGEKGSGTRPLSNVQDFHQLKKELLANHTLFEDPEFPAKHSSIFGAKHVEVDIEWVRPPGIVPDPKLFINGSSRFEVIQGFIGDCWLLAASANLAMNPKLFFQVVPEDQSFESGHYAGIFHFRFWQYGRWVDVVIDDRLPMHKKKLHGSGIAGHNIFWSALLEKAFAKLYGSYEVLTGGNVDEGQEDFTGGITVMYEQKDLPSDMFDILLKAQEKNSLIGCSLGEYEGRHKDNKTLTEREKLKGLMDGHAYSVTNVKYVHNKTNNNETIPLVRVRNPWGDHSEWTGAWSDDSWEWDSISDHEKEEIGFKSAKDGEFWMSFEDVKDYFSDIEIGYLNVNSMMNSNKMSSDKIEWETSAFEGEWVRGATAGGPNEKFLYNPQYRITLEEESTVIVALMQKNLRIQGRKPFEYSDIRFSIYPLTRNGSDSTEELPKPLDPDYFRNSENTELDIELIPRTTRSRKISARVELQPGAYIIIPYILDSEPSDIEGEFLLRVYSEHPNNLEEYTEPMSIHDHKEVLDDKEIETLREFFRLLAGDDWELDWIELKKLIDYEMFNGKVHEEGFSKYMSRSVIAMLNFGKSGKVGFEEFKAFWNDFEKLKEVFHRIKNESVDDVSEDVGEDAVDDHTVEDDNDDDDDNDIDNNDGDNNANSDDIEHDHTVKDDNDDDDDNDIDNNDGDNNANSDDIEHQDNDYDVDDDGDYLSTFHLRRALHEAGVDVNNHVLGRMVRRFGSEKKMIKFEDFVMCAMRIKRMLSTFEERFAALNWAEWLDASLYF